MSRTLKIQNRKTGEVATTLDVTGWAASQFDRMWDGLVYKVDFEKWMPVFEPEIGDDQSVADWLS